MADTQAATRLREYETIFLVKPDLTDDNVDKLKERVRGIVAREGGKVIRFTVWGKKKTLYPIAKQPRAIYIHANFLGNTRLVAEVERNLRIFDEVTRYLSVKLADEVDPETRPVLEDLKLAGDVEETRPGAAPAAERVDTADEAPEADEETTEEA
ncbi:30S ribosomal protein S6 [Archangium violaceum]|uniref:30S ribosomal protein S6 n=1 Tax=Archangium violaceum TaxID=83451 RepID=UPI00193C0994|nr:30S ribosomal protein S6 [Archangium violaceum]QRK05003.1 30S ribosomal protein S6 [Archangium violaceum]